MESAEAGNTDSAHIVFFVLAGTGHLNPVLLLISEVGRSTKHRVSVFSDEGCAHLVRAAGAEWRPYPGPEGPMSSPIRPLDAATVSALVPPGTPEAHYKHNFASVLWSAEQILPTLLAELRSMLPRPSVIVHDWIVSAAALSAQILGVPSVSLVLFPGPGAYPMADDATILEMEQKPWVEHPRQQIIDTYGIDPLENSLAGVFTALPSCNLVQTIPELFAAPREGLQSLRFSDCIFHCYGYTVDARSSIRAESTNSIVVDQ